MPFADAGAGALYWKLEGAAGAPPFVLLNSVGTDMDLWAPVLPMLVEHVLLLRIDTRGHGESSAPAGDYRLGALADDVARVRDAAGVERAAVAGVSLGGMIAMELALAQPSRVTALALVCTLATMDRAARAERVDRVRGHGMAAIADLAMPRFLSAEFIAGRPGVAASVRRALLAMPPEGYAGCAAAIRDMALRDRLGVIGCPTLVVTSVRDSSTPLQSHGEHLLAAIAGARHFALDAAHLAPLEAPGPLADALLTLHET